jgi:hypothetical protein
MCVSFLLRMLTQFFFVSKGNFYCSVTISISSPCQQGCALLFLYIFVFAFSFPLLNVSYFQFFQNLKRKIQENELEQTNLQETSKVRVAPTFVCHIFVTQKLLFST